MVLLSSLAANFSKPLISAPLGHSFLSIAYRPFSVSRLFRQIDMETVDTSKRLAQLRALMKENKVDIYSAQGGFSLDAGRLTFKSSRPI
jgi:hypothetical protein